MNWGIRKKIPKILFSKVPILTFILSSMEIGLKTKFYFYEVFSYFILAYIIGFMISKSDSTFINFSYKTPGAKEEVLPWLSLPIFVLWATAHMPTKTAAKSEFGQDFCSPNYSQLVLRVEWGEGTILEKSATHKVRWCGTLVQGYCTHPGSGTYCRKVSPFPIHIVYNAASWSWEWEDAIPHTQTLLPPSTKSYTPSKLTALVQMQPPLLMGNTLIYCSLDNS